MTERTLGDLTPFDSSEEDYRQEVRLTLERVFYDFAVKDRPVRFSGPEEEQAFLSNKLLVFKDALRRGQNPVQQKLTTEGIIFPAEDGTAVKKYTLDQNFLKWQLLPKSEDPFDRMDFIKSYREKGLDIEGEGDFWTDPLIINRVLEEGIRQQDASYSTFLQSYRAISTAAQMYPHSLAYLHSPQTHFQYLEEVYTSLGETSSDQERKQHFIVGYLASDNSIADKSLAALKICEDISLLGQLFTRNKTYDSLHNRGIYILSRENSLAVELLTNPQGFDSIQSLEEPVTSVERVAKLRGLIHFLENNFQDPDRLVNIYLLVVTAVDNLQDNLEPLFVEAGISPDLGMEFIHSLLLEKLKDLPGRQYINTGFDGRETIDPNINHYYHLKNPIRVPPEPKGTRKTQQPSISVDAFVVDLFAMNHFPLAVFGRFDESEKADTIRRILDRASQLSDMEYERKLNKLVSALRFNFNGTSQIADTRSPKGGAKYPWLASTQKSFLTICLDRINKEDNRLTDFFGKQRIRIALVESLRQGHFPVRRDAYLKHISLSGIEREKVMDKAINDAAFYSLLTFYEEAGVSLDQAINRIIAEALAKLPPKQNLPYLLEDIDADNLKSRIRIRVNQYLNQVKEHFLPADYETNKAQYISRAISSSIKEI